MTLSLDLGREEKFAVQSASWAENKVFLPGDQLRLEVVSGQGVLRPWHSEARAQAAVRTVAYPAAAGVLAAAIAPVTAA